MRTILTAVFTLMLASLASAKDIYVNNVLGNDDLAGLAERVGAGGGPVRSIQRALCLAAVGDTVHLANNGLPYQEMVSIAGRIRGTSRHPLVLDGHGATLDGTVMADARAWRHVENDVFAFRPRRLTYQQLFHNGAPLKMAPFPSWEGATPQLQAMEWTLRGALIYLRVEENYLPQDYGLRHCGLQTGITVYNTRDVMIKNLVIEGFQQDGISVHDTTKNCQIEGVECRANGRCGISVGGASRVKVGDSSCYDNGRSNLRIAGFARVVAEKVDVDEKKATLPIDLQSGRLTIDGREMVR